MTYYPIDWRGRDLAAAFSTGDECAGFGKLFGSTRLNAAKRLNDFSLF